MKPKYPLIVIAGLFGIAPMVSVAQNAQQHTEEIYWKSTNDSRAEIPEALAKLYASLYNTEKLPVAQVPIQKGQTVEELLREAGVFIGPHFPVELDSLLCDLNADQCTRDLVSANPATYQDPSAHVGGYTFTKGDWTSQPGQSIAIPMLQFEEYEEFSVSWKNAGESIEDILRSRGVTCESYGVDCMKAVRIFNVSNPGALEDAYEGELILPARGVSTIIQLGTAEEPVEMQRQTLRQIRQYPEYIEQTQDRASVNDQAYNALKDRAVTTGEGKFHATLSSEPLFSKQLDLLRLIGHPRLDPGWNPGLDWSAGKVAVLDSFVDDKHCDIGANVDVHNVDSATGTSPTDQSGCGTIETHANAIEHHGTHIAALLGASLNDKGIGGLLPPESTVYTHEIKEHLLGNDQYRDQVSSDIWKIAVNVEPKTYNMSWSYTNSSGGNDVIQNAINVMKGFALVVAPAGNDKQNFNAGGCSVMPACFHELPNVITVVGLNRDEDNAQLWVDDATNLGSSFASFFHVGAIADEIFSATGSHRHGVLSGTSQAAPQVAATASYLWAMLAAKAETVEPQDVKNRIIYTADYFPHLANKVLGGRLNMAKALNIGSTVITKTNGDHLTGVFDSYMKFDDSEGAGIVMLRDGTKIIEIDFRKFKRLIRDNSGTSYVAYYVDDNNRLIRKTGVTLRTLSQKINVIPVGASAVVPVTMADIADYTAPF